MSQITKEEHKPVSQNFTNAAKKAIRYLVQRLSEASTIRAIIVLSSAFMGYSFGDQIEEFVVIGVIVAQTIALFLPDSIASKKDSDDDQASG